MLAKQGDRRALVKTGSSACLHIYFTSLVLEEMFHNHEYERWVCMMFIGQMISLLHHHCAYGTEFCCSGVLSLEWIKVGETSSQGALDGALPTSFERAPINLRMFFIKYKKYNNNNLKKPLSSHQNVTGDLAVSLVCGCLTWGGK